MIRRNHRIWTSINHIKIYHCKDGWTPQQSQACRKSASWRHRNHNRRLTVQSASFIRVATTRRIQLLQNTAPRISSRATVCWQFRSLNGIESHTTHRRSRDPAACSTIASWIGRNRWIRPRRIVLTKLASSTPWSRKTSKWSVSAQMLGREKVGFRRSCRSSTGHSQASQRCRWGNIVWRWGRVPTNQKTSNLKYPKYWTKPMNRSPLTYRSPSCRASRASRRSTRSRKIRFMWGRTQSPSPSTKESNPTKTHMQSYQYSKK